MQSSTSTAEGSVSALSDPASDYAASEDRPLSAGAREIQTAKTG
jgi:hypothetical protein